MVSPQLAVSPFMANCEPTNRERPHGQLCSDHGATVRNRGQLLGNPENLGFSGCFGPSLDA